tara:strand:- start:224 stop:1324 length:1101 start_codon:yes stop_codon:yes gene_type:complete
MLGGLAYEDCYVLEQVRSGRKNIIINGAMNVCQRFAVNTANNINNATHTYHVDRFKAYESTDAILQGEWLDSDAPSGFYNSLFYHPVGTDTTLANEQFGFISQVIELNNMRHLGYGGSYAKTCTLSFYVKSNLTGTFCVALLNDGTNNRGFVTEYTIDSANTWERKVITIPGDTSGTWNSNGLRIAWTLVSSGNRRTTTVGSWFTDSTVRYATNKQVNFMTSASNTFKITGVQFETGNYATDFEHRSYAEELSLCQRYYQKLSGAALTYYGVGNIDGANQAQILVNFITEMRAAPSSLQTSGTAGDYFIRVTSNATCTSVPTLSTRTTKNALVEFFSSGHGFTSGQACFGRAANVSDSFLAFNAEL